MKPYIIPIFISIFSIVIPIYSQTSPLYFSNFENISDTSELPEWSSTGNSASITNENSYPSNQPGKSIFIPPAEPEHIVSLFLDRSDGTTIVPDNVDVLFVDYYMQFTASTPPDLPALTDPVTTALVTVQPVQSDDSNSKRGEWVFSNGKDKNKANDNDSWLHSGKTIELDESNRTAWYRITIRLNLKEGLFDVFIDGKLTATNLRFLEDVSSGLEAINIYGNRVGATYLDDLSLTTSNPLLADSNLNVDNSFEKSYNIDGQGIDSKSDGLTDANSSMNTLASNIVSIDLPANGTSTQISEVNGNVLITTNNGFVLFDEPLDGIDGLIITGLQNSGDVDVSINGALGFLDINGDLGTVEFNGALTVTTDLKVSGAETASVNQPVRVNGTTTIDTSNGIYVNASLNGGNDVTLNTTTDLILSNGSVDVAGGNLSCNVGGAILLDNFSSFNLDNSNAELGRMQLNSGETITVSNNSLINTANSHMILGALDYISLANNSAVTATDGYVIIQRCNEFTLEDSTMFLNNVTLFLQVQNSLGVTRSAINIEGGIAQLSVFVDAIIDDFSSLIVNNGDLYAQVNRNLTVGNNSQVMVTEGNIGLNVIGDALVKQSSRLELRNSTVSDKSLQLIVSGTTTFDNESVLAVKDAELNIFSFDNINLFNSTLSVLPGAVLTNDAFIRTNANLALTNSTLSTDSSNLSVNIADSMYVTGGDIVVNSGNLYLNTRVDLIMNTSSALNVTGGDLYANVFGGATLGGAINLENLFAVYVQGTFTLTKNGSLDTSIVYLSSGYDIVIDGQMKTNKVDGKVYLVAQNLIDMKKSDHPITSELLSAISNTGIFLRTEVNSLSVQTIGRDLENKFTLGNYTGSAEIEVHEENNVTIDTAYNTDGPIRVIAGGTITANQVVSAKDASGHNVGLMSTGGDIEIGSVSVGTTNGQISLSASGEIRELSDFDTTADLIGNMAVIYAGTSIGTGDAALETNTSELELHEFVNEEIGRAHV